MLVLQNACHVYVRMCQYAICDKHVVVPQFVLLCNHMIDSTACAVIPHYHEPNLSDFLQIFRNVFKLFLNYPLSLSIVLR